MRALAVLTLLAALITACGDGDDAPPATAPPSSTLQPSTAPPGTVANASTTAPTDIDSLQGALAWPGPDEAFYMVNLIRYRDHARYLDGRTTDLTGEEADALYRDYMAGQKLPEIGAEIVFLADVEQDLIGGTAFDRVVVVRYPSRAAFADMLADPEFQAMRIHTQAGVADTLVLAALRIDDAPLPPAVDPPFPATADDPPFAFVHLLDFRDTAHYREGDADPDDTRSGREAVARYSTNAGAVAIPLGVRPIGWFEVVATAVGPPDVWEEVRINLFPSHATFDALTSDPTWAAGAHHRSAGLQQTYALQTLPTRNHLA